MAILKTLEVTSWEKIPGTYCRVLASYGKVHAIDHLLKDKWFNPELDLQGENNAPTI